MRVSAWSSPRPGGTRQSTFNCARDGITLIFSEALAIVGAIVTPSIGSSSTAISGSRGLDLGERRGQVRAVDPKAVQERVGLRRVLGHHAAAGERLEDRRHLRERVVADPRDRGVAGAARGWRG